MISTTEVPDNDCRMTEEFNPSDAHSAPIYPVCSVCCLSFRAWSATLQCMRNIQFVATIKEKVLRYASKRDQIQKKHPYTLTGKLLCNYFPVYRMQYDDLSSGDQDNGPASRDKGLKEATVREVIMKVDFLCECVRCLLKCLFILNKVISLSAVARWVDECGLGIGSRLKRRILSWYLCI